MSKSMLAVVKPEPKAGAEVREVPVPQIGPADVLVKVKVASICGTDLHIYEWDPWAAGRIKTPLVPGHEFCGTVAAVGSEVKNVKEGDYVSAEMHVACGHCYQCRIGEAHICQSVKVLGVDADGAFAEYVRIPATNIWKLDGSIPEEYGSILDPLGNAVHTVLSGEIAGRTIAVVGCGPIGLFAIAVARACGASQVFALEINEHRRKLAEKMKADFVLNPAAQDVKQFILEKTNGVGVDVVAEMSGHPDGIKTGFKVLRFGGRVSLLGTPTRPVEMNLADDVIFKGATVYGVHGRLMYKTWFQMEGLLKTHRLDLMPVITDKIAIQDFSKAMAKLKTGEASKILVYPNGIQ